MQRAGCSREVGQRLVGALVFRDVVEAPFMLLHGASAGDEAIQLAVHITGLHLSAGPAQRAKVRARRPPHPPRGAAQASAAACGSASGALLAPCPDIAPP